MKDWSLLLVDGQGITIPVPTTFVSASECSRAGSAWQTTVGEKNAKSICIERSTSVADTTVVPAKTQLYQTSDVLIMGLVGFIIGVLASYLTKQVTAK